MNDSNIYKNELHNKVRAIINEVDPIGLISMSAPENEYDPEVNDIVNYLNNSPIDSQNLGIAIKSIFIKWFGSEYSDYDDVYEKISYKIMALLNKGIEADHGIMTKS